MLRQYPQLFNLQNLDNSLVMSDDRRIVCHVGMTERWASFGGCKVEVACIGAVATYEEYRSRGLATRTFQAACDKARADGIDLMMISGDRGLYRRAGATKVGRDWNATLDLEAVQRLADPGVHVAAFLEADLLLCVTAYSGKLAHFIRPPEDWRGFLKSGYCMNRRARFLLVHRGSVFCGYLIVSEPNAEGLCAVLEFAGEQSALAAALRSLTEYMECTSVRVHLQPFDFTLHTLLSQAGAYIEPAPTSGTLLLINVEQFMQRLTPWFIHRLGPNHAERFRYGPDRDGYVLKVDDQALSVKDKAALAEALFGQPAVELPSPFNEVFPLPALWYGINYV